MKRLVMILSLMLAAACFAGCAVSGAGSVDITAAPETTKAPINGSQITIIDPATLGTQPPTEISAEALFWETLRGSDGTDGELRYEVYTELDAFKAEFGSLPLDFDSRYTESFFNNSFVTVIRYYAPTGGYSFVYNKANIDGHTVNIEFDAVKPTGLVTQAFEEHIIFVAFSKANLKEDMKFNIKIGSLSNSDAKKETM